METTGVVAVWHPAGTDPIPALNHDPGHFTGHPNLFGAGRHVAKPAEVTAPARKTAERSRKANETPRNPPDRVSGARAGRLGVQVPDVEQEWAAACADVAPGLLRHTGAHRQRQPRRVSSVHCYGESP